MCEHTFCFSISSSLVTLSVLMGMTLRDNSIIDLVVLRTKKLYTPKLSDRSLEHCAIPFCDIIKILVLKSKQGYLLKSNK